MSGWKLIEDNSLCLLMFRWWCITCWWVSRSVGKGVHLNPLSASKDFIHRPAIILNFLLFVSGPLASLPLRTTAIQASLVAAMHPVCSWRTSRWMWIMRISGLRSCDVRTHVNTCVDKSLPQVLESSPVVLNSLESYTGIHSLWKCMEMYCILW